MMATPLNHTGHERISPAQALALAREAPLHELCSRAFSARQNRFGQKAFYIYNQHLNFTNICQNACRFCAFGKRAGDQGAYTYTPDEIRERILARITEPIQEVHIVGGLNPDLSYEYYLDCIRAVKELRPTAKVKAFTAVEVSFLARTYGRSIREVLKDFRSAELDALPGGGAEVFSPRLRKDLCPEKISGEEWLRVHEEAHTQGIPTNATMLFGHIETWEDRIDHLAALRDLQDRTGGFRCFIPLPYQPANNPLQAPGPDGIDIIRLIAVSRLFLDNIDHIKAYWVMTGMKLAQVALWAGADDLDGTLVEEKVGHAAGARGPKGLTIEELRTAITQAGFEPVERDTFFERMK
ncbi:MAG: aminofutalosine synthase MqnE [Desulfovibrionales bacterium]